VIQVRDNTCLSVALEELGAAGVRDVRHAPGGKHRQLGWNSPNGPRFYNVSTGAPSDPRAILNTRADIRRMLRADGMLIDDRAPAPPRPLSRIERLEQRLAALELEVAQLRNGGEKP
jgi:hypothetical protein